MRKLDELLSPHVSDAARDQARRPDFAVLRARGQRRRHLTQVAAVGGTAAAVLGVVLGTQLAPSTQTVPPPVASHPTPSETPGTAQITPEQIVDDPDSTIRRLVVSPTDPDVRAAVWALCLDTRCQRSLEALAITDDGFDTRTVLRGYDTIEAAGPSAFYVSSGVRTRLLVDTDGTQWAVGLVPDTAPLARGEVLVHNWYGSSAYLALDPTTATAHRLPLSEGINDLTQTVSGRLTGVVYANRSATFVWSDDGGSTWQRHDLPTGETTIFDPAPSASPGTMAVVVGADGATLFPFIAMHRSTDDGANWDEFDEGVEGPRAYIAGSAVLPDGRLLVNVIAWSDQRQGHPGKNPVGIYVSDGDDWASLAPVQMGAPFDDAPPADAFSPIDVVEIVAAEGQLTLYATNGGGAVYASTDAGQNWQPVPAR